jgi:hypothetical protein
MAGKMFFRIGGQGLDASAGSFLEGPQCPDLQAQKKQTHTPRGLSNGAHFQLTAETKKTPKKSFGVCAMKVD